MADAEREPKQSDAQKYNAQVKMLHSFFDAYLSRIDETAEDPPPAEPPGRKGKNINARMQETIFTNADAKGWTARQWAQHLRCSSSTIANTETWKSLAMVRDLLKAEKARDRRGRNVPRRAPE